MSEENQGVKKMKEEDFKPQMPDIIMEVIFDVGYLIFDLIAASIISFGCYNSGNTQGLNLLDYMQQINPCFYLTKRYPIQSDSAILYKKIK